MVFRFLNNLSVPSYVSMKLKHNTDERIIMRPLLILKAQVNLTEIFWYVTDCCVYNTRLKSSAIWSDTTLFSDDNNLFVFTIKYVIAKSSKFVSSIKRVVLDWISI
jgi:hypothetical protein